MPCDKRGMAALISFCLVACAIQSSENQVLIYKKKYIMGTVFEIAAYDHSPDHASAAIEKAFEEIIGLDDLLSNYKPQSALSNLNRSAHFHQEVVPADLYRIVEQSVQYSRMSGGKFDISVAPLVNLWKAALLGEKMPSREQEEAVRSCVGYEKIELTPPDRISFRSSCLRIDLGAIGKGYAVDRAVEVLRSSGIQNALINAGGSTLFAMGSPPGQNGWLLHLRDPSAKVDPQVVLTDESVSTSEQTAPSLLGKDSPGHIIDPDTGIPLKSDFAVSAISRTATESDALSTTLLLLGPIKGRELVHSMTSASAVWISHAAQVETVSNGRRILFGKGL